LYRRDLARTHHNLGQVLELVGRPKDAESAFRQALDLQRRLVEEFPRDPSYRLELAGSHNGLANSLDNSGRSSDAESEYRQALAIQQRLADDFPRVTRHRSELAHTHYNLATLLERDRRREAEQSYRHALDLLQRLVDESPEVPAQLNELGRTSGSLAELLLRQGQTAEAREFAERAIRHQQAALKLLPRQPAYGRALVQHFRVLAEALVRLSDHRAAAQSAAEIPRPSGPDQQLDRFAAGILARCISLAEQDSALAVEKRESLARAYGDRAITLLRQGSRRVSNPALDQLNADPNLAPLHRRADFQKLIRDLEEAAGPGDK
jgi:tetratricopeptide (TPR) repeat protein